MSKNADEIAQKYGGSAVLDPDEIAKKYGGASQSASQTTAEPHSWAGFGQNVLTSGANFLGDVGHAVVHPFESGTGLVNTAAGLILKMTPARFKVAGILPQEQLVDAIGQHYKDRYGSLEAAQKAIYEDPVGVAADLSTLATGVSGIAGVAAKLPVVSEVAGQIAKTTGTIAKIADPLQVVTRPTGEILRRMEIPEKLYASSLKAAPRSNAPEDVAAMVQTGLQNRLPISEGGLTKLQGLLKNLQSQVAAHISGAPEAQLDPVAVAARTGRAEDYFAQRVNPQADLESISRVRNEYLAKHSVEDTVQVGTRPVPVMGSNGQPLLDASGKPITRTEPVWAKRQRIVPESASEAQGEKQVTGTELRKSYDELSSAERETQKDLVRGLKEELEARFPEIKNLNAAQAKLYDLEPELQTAVNRMRNREPFGLIPAGVSAAAGAATHSPDAAIVAGLLSAIVSSPNVRSRLAFAVDAALKNKGLTSSGVTALSRVDKYVDELNQAIR